MGLLATQGIRGGANREVLKRIKESGDMFFAESDRDWILDGANVHVSMIGFDNATQRTRVLDGKHVDTINANLTATSDVTTAKRLRENAGIAFMGDTKGGPFEIKETRALSLLLAPNPHGRPNSDVIVPWVNGKDITQRSRHMFIIDFGLKAEYTDVALYENAFSYAQEHVLPARSKSRTTIQFWWLHERPRVDMRSAIQPLPRFIATVNVSKHRLFVWMTSPTLPDHALFIFARSDDYSFGILHSRLHEVWTRAQGTQVRERESGFRYTATTCFETFPLPACSAEIRTLIGTAASELDDLRNRWLNPPEWTRESVLEFPGSANGPWGRYVKNSDESGNGTVNYPRLFPKDDKAASQLAKRTLTNLYNERPAWLELAHRKIDDAVFAAYGWDPTLSDEDILSRLLALNQERAALESSINQE
jgi:hypothetical protein